MNAATKEMESLSAQVPAVVLPPKERAVAALAMAGKEPALQELAAKTKDITAISNDDGREQVSRARITLKNQRLAIANIATEAREDATAFSRAVIAEEKRLIGYIKPEEDRLQGLQDGYDARIERERQEAIEKEIARVAAIRDRITELRESAPASVGKPSEAIKDRIAEIERDPIDESYAEFRQEALDAKIAALSRMREVYAAALNSEEEQRRAAADRAELAQRREQEAEQRRQEDARKARAQAILDDIMAIGAQPQLATTGEQKGRRVRKGGTRECIVATLEETELWPIGPDTHGEFVALAENARANAVAAIRAALIDFDRKADEDRQAAAQRAKAAEVQRLADEEAHAAEQERLAEQQRAESRAQAERDAEAARQQQSAATIATTAPESEDAVPNPQEILLAVAEGMGVTTSVALEWIRKIDWEVL